MYLNYVFSTFFHYHFVTEIEASKLKNGEKKWRKRWHREAEHLWCMPSSEFSDVEFAIKKSFFVAFSKRLNKEGKFSAEKEELKNVALSLSESVTREIMLIVECRLCCLPFNWKMYDDDDLFKYIFAILFFQDEKISENFLCDVVAFLSSHWRTLRNFPLRDEKSFSNSRYGDDSLAPRIRFNLIFVGKVILP